MGCTNSIITIIPFDIYTRNGHLEPIDYIDQHCDANLIECLRKYSIIHYFEDTSMLSSKRFYKHGFICKSSLVYGSNTLYLILCCCTDDLIMTNIAPILRQTNNIDIPIRYNTYITGPLSHKSFIFDTSHAIIDFKDFNSQTRTKLKNILETERTFTHINIIQEILYLFGAKNNPKISSVNSQCNYYSIDEQNAYVRKHMHEIIVIYHDTISGMRKREICDSIVEDYNSLEVIREFIVFYSLEEVLNLTFSSVPSENNYVKYYSQIVKGITPGIYARYHNTFSQHIRGSTTHTITPNTPRQNKNVLEKPDTTNTDTYPKLTNSNLQENQPQPSAPTLETDDTQFPG